MPFGSKKLFSDKIIIYYSAYERKLEGLSNKIRIGTCFESWRIYTCFFSSCNTF